MLRQIANTAVYYMLFVTAVAHAQKPALVQNVDEEGRVPYQQEVQGYCNSTISLCYADFQIPSGQRLVISHVSGNLTTSAAVSGLIATLTYGPALPSVAQGALSGADQFFPLTEVGPTSSGKYGYILNQETTYFASGANSVRVILQPLGGAPLNANSLLASVTGYLVTVTSGN